MFSLTGVRLTQIRLSHDQFYGTVVVAVVAVREMKMSFYDIADVVSVGNSFVSAARTVDMTFFVTVALVLGCTAYWIRFVDLEYVCFDFVSILMMEASIVKIVDVSVVSDAGVTTPRSVLVIVFFVLIAAHFDILL